MHLMHLLMLLLLYFFVPNLLLSNELPHSILILVTFYLVLVTFYLVLVIKTECVQRLAYTVPVATC